MFTEIYVESTCPPGMAMIIVNEKAFTERALETRIEKLRFKYEDRSIWTIKELGFVLDKTPLPDTIIACHNIKRAFKAKVMEK